MSAKLSMKFAEGHNPQLMLIHIEGGDITILGPLASKLQQVFDCLYSFCKYLLAQYVPCNQLHHYSKTPSSFPFFFFLKFLSL